MDEVLPNPTSQPENHSFRFTAHFFIQDPSSAVLRNMFLKHDLRYPTEMLNSWPKDWPPAFLWDFLYGLVIFKYYGNKSAGDLLNGASSSNFYPKGIQTATQQMKDLVERKKEKERQKRQEQEQDGARTSRRTQDWRDFPETVLGLWMKYRFNASGRRDIEQQIEELERRRQDALRATAEKVHKWRQEVAESEL